MKRSSYLQTLYLQKPWLLIILITIVATFPWFGLGDSYTKGKPQETVLAISMLEHSNWIVPIDDVDELVYKSPLDHWIVTGFSYLFNDGEVTPFASRLPSVIGAVGLIGVCFMFFARRRSTLEAFVACLIIITCFEMHRAAVTTSLDMLFTFFIVTGIIQLFVWQEKKENRYLLSSWLFLSLATLVKGSIGIVLPCVIFGIYLLIEKGNFIKVIGKCLLVAIPSVVIPLIWYILTYPIKGEGFTHIVFSENFVHFWGLNNETLGMYRLGAEKPWWFYFTSLIIGFMPYTLLMVISLFFLKYSKLSSPITKSVINWWNKLREDKVQIFSFITIIVTLILYTLPASKRSIYIMSVYPFIALFMAQYMLYLVQNRPNVVRIYTIILLGVATIAALLSALCLTQIIDLERLGHFISERNETLRGGIELLSNGFKKPSVMGVIVILALIYAVLNSVYLLRKHSNIKVLMVSFGLILAMNIYLDGCILPDLKKGYTRPIVEKSFKKHDLNNLSVTDDLVE